jgi:cyclohexanecarboxylate-CoA ligase
VFPKCIARAPSDLRSQARRSRAERGATVPRFRTLRRQCGADGRRDFRSAAHVQSASVRPCLTLPSTDPRLRTPAHIAALLKTEVLEGRQFEYLRQVVFSGSYCPPALKRALEEKLANGCAFELWGMTETFAVLLGDPREPASARYDWIGRPTPGSQARIADSEGEPLPPNTEGELQVRGCSVFAGYFDNAVANSGIFSEDGWLRTGDLAVMSETGHVRITGRIKDIINRGGVKLNPSDVEALIDHHEAVLQNAIVPVPDQILGERACCCVVLKPGQTLSLDALCAWLQSKGVAKIKWPELLVSITEMPMTPTRKIIKGALIKFIKDQQAGNRGG